MSKQETTGHFNNSWLNIDKTDDPSFFVKFLDASRARALEIAKSNPQAAFNHLELSNGLDILDCGCGTGDMLSLMAKQIGSGQAVGIELSRVMVEEANRRAKSGPGNITFSEMDVKELTFPDAEFDRVMATQLLIHVPDPKEAFNEMCRVTAPRGIIALADIDWDSLTLECDDLELGRRFCRYFSNGILNGTIVREYAAWFAEAGFADIKTIPQPMMMDRIEFLKDWMVKPSLVRYVSDGYMTESEAGKLLDNLDKRAQRGGTFSGATIYTVVARKV